MTLEWTDKRMIRCMRGVKVADVFRCNELKETLGIVNILGIDNIITTAGNIC